jgi:hypothetical protein
VPISSSSTVTMPASSTVSQTAVRSAALMSRRLCHGWLGAV